MVTEDAVREVLKNVRDPEIGLDVINLGLVYDISINNKALNVDMTLTTPACPVGPQMIGEAQMLLHERFPDLDEVNINLVWSPFWNPSMMSDEAKEELGIF
ncbi:MAG: metal-sulfur cluster assembly factor [Anaerolineae bacterium]|nr:metal-sulfur cluster assembly factor [Anaerolineae bacterium]